MTLYVLQNVSTSALLKNTDGSIVFYSKKKFAKTVRNDHRNAKGERIYDIVSLELDGLKWYLAHNSEINN